MTYKNALCLLLLLLTLPCAALAATINYTYDAAGRLTKEAYSDGTVVEYAYDAAGNRTGHTVTLSSTTSSISATTTTTALATTTTTQQATTTIGATTTTTTIGGGTTTTAQPSTTTTVSGTTTTTACPATEVLGSGNPKLDNLRDFRDSRLSKSAIGRTVIQIYYNNAGSINTALERSPALRTVTRSAFEIIAPMVGGKEN